MKILQIILNAVTGWIAGLLTLGAWSYLWPKIFPIEERASALPGGWKLLITIMLIISPFALVGGFLGGRLPKEGGRKEVILYSALFGAIAALLFGTCGFWYLAW